MSAALILTLVLGSGAPSPSATQEFQVVVHSSVRGSWISRASLSALFTRKADRWGGDKAVARPVDQSAKSSVRQAFTAAVLGLSMGEMQRYWQDRVSSDRVFPPPIKASDEEVLAYVMANEGAVGYVGPATVIPAGVKVISVTE